MRQGNTRQGWRNDQRQTRSSGLRARRQSMAGTVVVLGLLSGCASSGLDLPASAIAPVATVAAFTPNAGAQASSSAAEPSATNTDRASGTPAYRIRANDLLALRFFFNSELDQDVRVQPDGAISVPLLGTRHVAGLSLPELSSLLRDTFARELRQPELSVQLLEAAERRVYVGGAVQRPQEVLHRDGLTPIEVVMSAGGFSNAARSNQIVLIRKDADGRPVPALVDLEDMMLDDAPVVLLEPWDIVFVPKDNITKAGEWVDKYVRNLLLINGLSFGYDLNPD